MPASSITRNVTVSGHRTSIRLDPSIWEALEEITVREVCTVHEICTLVDRHRGNSSLTAALRVFIVAYYRAAATEAGHEQAGHGQSPSAILVGLSGLSGRAQRSGYRGEASDPV